MENLWGNCTADRCGMSRLKASIARSAQILYDIDRSRCKKCINCKTDEFFHLLTMASSDEMLHPLWPLTVSGVTPKDQEEEEEEGEEEEALALPLPDDEPVADAADAADAADTVHGVAEERFPPDFASTPVPDEEEEEKALAVPLPDDEGVADAADAADAGKGAADAAEGAADAAKGAADAADAAENAANAAEEIVAGHPPELVSTSASSGSTSSVYYTAESGTSSGSASSQYVTAESGSEAEEVRLEFSGFESVSDLCPRYNYSFLTTNCNRRWIRGA